MKNEFQKLLARVVGGESLTQEQAQRAFLIMMMDGATPAQIAALLTALRIKGETVDEITGAAEVLRTKALPVQAPPGAIDTCGTGGDGRGTLNISTAAALVVAACGVPVVKHGNRAVSSLSGSADVLNQLGATIDMDAAWAETCLRKTNFCFLMAPRFHPGLRHITPVRQELGFRTIFNLLGPLANPAKVKRQLLGVYSEALLEPMAEVLMRLGTTHAWVVHGEGGLDELSISGMSHVVEIKDGGMRRFTVMPEEAGLMPSPLESIKGGDAHVNALAITNLFAKSVTPYRDAVLLNAAAALIVAGKAADLRQGIALAADVIDRHAARETLARFIECSTQMKKP